MSWSIPISLLGFISLVAGFIYLIINAPPIDINIALIFEYVFIGIVTVLFPLSILYVSFPNAVGSIKKRFFPLQSLDDVNPNANKRFNFNLIHVSVGFLCIFFFIGLYILFVPSLFGGPSPDFDNKVETKPVDTSKGRLCEQ